MSHRIATLCLLLVATLMPALPVSAAPVDINSADAATLARELKGVGETKAAAIVEYRRTHGPFKTIDDLALVKGIGQKLVDRNRSDLRLSRVAAGVAPISGKSAPVASQPLQQRLAASNWPESGGASVHAGIRLQRL